MTPSARSSSSTSDSCSLIVSIGRVQASPRAAGLARRRASFCSFHSRAISLGARGRRARRAALAASSSGRRPPSRVLPARRRPPPPCRFSSDWRSAGARGQPEPVRARRRAAGPSPSSRACSSTCCRQRTGPASSTLAVAHRPSAAAPPRRRRCPRARRPPSAGSAARRPPQPAPASSRASSARRPLAGEQELEHRREHRRSSRTPRRAGTPPCRGARRGGVACAPRVEPRRDEAPDLPEDDGRGEEDAAVEADLHQHVDLLDARGVDERAPPPGGSASSTGRIRKPKMGLAKTSDAAPSTSTAMTHLEQARAQLAEVLGQAHPCLDRLLLSHARSGSPSGRVGRPARLRRRRRARLDCRGAAAGAGAVAPGPAGAAEDGFAATTPSGGGNTEGYVGGRQLRAGLAGAGRGLDGLRRGAGARSAGLARSSAKTSWSIL